MSLLDGRIDCDVTEQIEGGNEYYEALEQLNCPSMLMGRVTMQMHYALPEPFVAESTEPIGQEQCHVAIKTKGYLVAIDTMGKLRWGHNQYDGMPLLVITSRDCPKEYLDTLTRQQKLELLEGTREDAQWLIRMVENLLSVTRIEDGRMNLNPTAELMEEIIDEALRHVIRHSGDHIIKVHSSDKYMLVHADAKLIVQVLVNLIDNAIKYSEKGGLVEITADAPDSMTVRIVVKDHGCGIRASDLPKIKTKFYKPNHTRRGSGIGLAVADEIIAMHGGTLEIESEEQVGTTVTITLPAEQAKL